VFKRAVDKTYRLKMKASRYLFNEVIDCGAVGVGGMNDYE
jgi:hypothetical protein